MGFSSAIKFSLISILILTISQNLMVVPVGALGTGGGTLIPQTCQKATQSSPGLSYDFCIKTLQSSSKSKTKELRWLGMIASSLAGARATYGGKRADVLLAKTQDPYAQAKLTECKRLYAEAWSDAKQAKYAFKTNNGAEGNMHMGYALNKVVACEDSWKEEKGHVSLLTKENYNLEQLSRMGVAIGNIMSRV
ncbi:hypothetical protein H6P81_009228 [Aristolochia fimbriata]|uniref:Pectinesterase inhibitor domain-containing protein n=1 Tax=Aristolochia fimbriata TaxID=158543 RepID=A0AAV7EKG9_ARIFI|nr:hypothetical protein H6P81_009228 [Aristolochia fimbriata]